MKAAAESKISTGYRRAELQLINRAVRAGLVGNVLPPPREIREIENRAHEREKGETASG